jgi:glycine/D-amino acid oxidase-like deaminating enzyme
MPGPSFVVIGAGIVGCLAARELAARVPQASVTVVDRDCVGAGASRRSAGLHLPRGATSHTRHMSAFSHAYYADLKLSHPRLPIHPVAATVIATPGAGGSMGGGYLSLAAPVPVARPHGSEITIPRGARAWRISGSHYADVYEVAHAIAAALRSRVRFLEGVEVTGLESGRHTVTVSTGTGERLVADAAVLAPGPWLHRPAWRHHLASLGLRVKKVAALHIEQRPHTADEAVILDDDDAFLLPLHSRGHWLFSFACQEWDVDPDRLTAGLSAADLGAARACLRRYSPALATAHGCGRVFCDAYSPGGGPQVRALDTGGQIVFAGAAGGSGYRLAPAIASEAVDLLRLAPRNEGVIGDHQYV